MLAGGSVPIYKSVMEIHHKLEGEDPNTASLITTKNYRCQRPSANINPIDAVFSFDSIITAGGTAKYVEIMIAAVVIAMFIMFMFSPKIAAFIHKHPTLKMLASSGNDRYQPDHRGMDVTDKAHELHLKNWIFISEWRFLLSLSC
ncbi:MAG: hypothetical protein QM796_18220 [Chthoniobacteraceae bacterium]